MWRRRNVLYNLVSNNNNHQCFYRYNDGRLFWCSEEEEAKPPSSSSLYSFLQPSIFSLPQPSLSSTPPSPSTPLQTQHHNQTSLQSSLSSHNTDAAWKAFKTLVTDSSSFPSKPLTNSLITHLSSSLHHNTLNLKRAFAVSLFFFERNPHVIEFDTVRTLLQSMRDANTPSPAFALVNSMFNYRFFPPFSVWADSLIDLARNNNTASFFADFLRLFNENWRVLLDEKIDFMRPSLPAFNAALEGCCYYLESVVDAESVVHKMAVLGVRPDESSFGFLAYLYALKGIKVKVAELQGLMRKLGFVDQAVFLRNLVSGYVKSGDLESVSDTVLGGLRDNEGSCFSEGTFCEIVRGFTQNGTIKDLANLISEAQKLENQSVGVEKSIGYGVINACIRLGFLDKAHNVLDEMNTNGCSIGLGVYIPILKAYCKEQRTTEATQLVMEISNSGLELDVYTYDALIEAAMAGQDFQSAFSLFRDLRGARVADLKASYLTIMTGLTENHRPELMAAFLDEVVDDPRIEIGTHDWNSILHAFCKAGRLEDARRTFRRMLFLQFEPNAQTYLSLINGYANTEKYFSVLMLWNEVKKRVLIDGDKRFKLDNNLVDAFLYALVKGGYFDAVMQVVEKSQEMKIFVDKWRYKQAFMEKHKKLKVQKLRRRNFKKMEALVAFKNWAGLST